MNNVTDKFYDMISAFEADCALGFFDFQLGEMSEKDKQRFIEHKKLFSELEFKLRHGTLAIFENIERSDSDE